MCDKQDPWADCQHHRRLRSWVPEFLEAAEQRPVPRRQPLPRMPTWQSSLFVTFTLNARQPLPCTSTWQFSVRSSRNLWNHSRAQIQCIQPTSTVAVVLALLLSVRIAAFFRNNTMPFSSSVALMCMGDSCGAPFFLHRAPFTCTVW